MSVRAEVANPEGKLSPGQFVQVRVELPEENNVLALPQTALTSQPLRRLRLRRACRQSRNRRRPQPAKPAAEPAATTEQEAAADAAKPAAEEQKPALVLAQVFVKPGRRNEGWWRSCRASRPATRS